jgi:ribosome maturation protein Sdo1
MAFSEKIATDKIEQCKINIVEFEKAEEKERETIREYQSMIDSGDSPFPTQSLESGIEQCKNKIIVFQEAADAERNTIKDLYNQIAHNQKQEAINKIKLNHIEVVR